jgi:hypothetical protein
MECPEFFDVEYVIALLVPHEIFRKFQIEIHLFAHEIVKTDSWFGTKLANDFLSTLTNQHLHPSRNNLFPRIVCRDSKPNRRLLIHRPSNKRSPQMIVLFSFLASSAIYAVDLGTQNIRIAFGVPGKPIEIKTNDQGGRATPNFLAFNPVPAPANLSSAEWFIGADAERIFQRNRSRGVRDPFHYLADPNSSEFSVDPIIASSVAFSILLRKVKRRHDRLIVAVPAVFALQARYSLLRSL